ncbi:CRISPR-associated protein Cas2 [Staphylococcus nepalensis]|uniref:CRISPR-associated protein Cas2 n=1 Tax=Staphylococcus nepalensis TaxID=214473 RepID=UPI001E301540|nr:CRISPR-associated protein Cas2 [Staphylococcus nepalensis]MCD8890961.1 CRISPR-associated protein Cas2 [Staphylococcus nepalensis]
MSKYVVSYDVNKGGQNYSELIKYLESFTKKVHIQESVWFIQSDLSKSSISNNIQNILDTNDEFLVYLLNDSPYGSVDDDVYHDFKEFFN